MVCESVIRPCSGLCFFDAVMRLQGLDMMERFELTTTKPCGRGCLYISRRLLYRFGHNKRSSGAHAKTVIRRQSDQQGS